MYDYQSIKESFIPWCRRNFSPYLHLYSFLEAFEEIAFGVVLIASGCLMLGLLTTLCILTFLAKVMVYGSSNSKVIAPAFLFKFNVYYSYLFALGLIALGLKYTLSLLLSVIRGLISIGYYFKLMVKFFANLMVGEAFLIKSELPLEFKPVFSYEFRFFNANIFISLIGQHIAHTQLGRFLLYLEASPIHYPSRLSNEIQSLVKKIKEGLRTKFINEPYFNPYPSYKGGLQELKQLLINLRLSVMGLLQIIISLFYFPIFMVMFCFTTADWSNFRKEAKNLSEDLAIDLVQGFSLIGVGLSQVIFYTFAIPIKLFILSIKKIRSWIRGETEKQPATSNPLNLENGEELGVSVTSEAFENGERLCVTNQLSVTARVEEPELRSASTEFVNDILNEEFLRSFSVHFRPNLGRSSLRDESSLQEVDPQGQKMITSP